METRSIHRDPDNLNEYFSSTLSLLSDTANFLSGNTKIFSRYKCDLQSLRDELESNCENKEVIGRVRSHIAEIRKSLRLQGYNLKRGSSDLRVEGFRNEDALSQGFKRCVFFLMKDGDVLYISGMSNHNELEDALESRLAATGYRTVSEKHHLWFKWTNRVLILSGAASETADNLELLKQYAASHKDHLLRKLNKLS